MQLTAAQQREIFQNGYTLLHGAVAPILVDEALANINQSLGVNGMHPDELPVLRAQSYCPELTSTPAITDLYNASPLLSLCESALGKGNILPVSSGQIALRFPHPAYTEMVPRPHLDGIATATNGVAPESYGNFTSLVAVFLSDVPDDEMGNFTVWPGTHRAYEKYFQTHGVESFLKGTPPIDLPEPVPIRARAGDAVLCHYQLGHGVAPNFSSQIRYAVFFRILHREHETHYREVLGDIWRDWPGIELGIKVG